MAAPPGRFDRLKEVALSYAFAIEVAGCAPRVSGCDHPGCDQQIALQFVDGANFTVPCGSSAWIEPSMNSE